MVSNKNLPTTPQELARYLRNAGVVTTPEIEAAFAAVPRHLFLPELPQEQVYADRSIAIKRDQNGDVISSSSQPSMMALMLSQLDLKMGHNVLEIGAGTGYNAALLQNIVGHTGRVTTVELDPDIARQAEKHLFHAGYGGVNVVNDDGANGYAPRAAYDRIICTAAIWDIPPAWLRQLKPGGLLVTPIWLDGMQVSAAFQPEPGGALISRENLGCAFVYLRGISEGPNVIKRIGSSGLTLMGDQVENLDAAALHMLFSADQEVCQLSQALEGREYWDGFAPYVMLNEPATDTFAMYAVSDNQKAYGVEGRGFALIAPGGASLVPFNGIGLTYCFAGVDAFMNLETLLKQWIEAGKPMLDQLRLRLLPKGHTENHKVENGKRYTRRYHDLEVWLE